MDIEKNQIVELMNFLDEEKINFKMEKNYLKMCDILKKIYHKTNNYNNDEINNLKENNQFLRISRKNLIKDNQKQYEELVRYRDLYNKINHKYTNIVRQLDKNKI
mgnify:FL=1|tara:strand:- start:1790 stop:2104 length:315 start_codon:yes stop_codon:yes gene_type:complete